MPYAPQIVAAWKKERGAELAAAAAADAVKRLDAGESWDAVAKSLAAPVQAAKFFGRSDQAVPARDRRLAFELPKPVGQARVYRSVQLDNGDTAVFGLSAPFAKSRARRSATAGDEARRQFAQQIAGAEAAGYAAAARADAKVIINPQAID